MKVEKVTLNKVKCPNGHDVVTSKTKNIQCKKCGKRFDL